MPRQTTGSTQHLSCWSSGLTACILIAGCSEAEARLSLVDSPRSKASSLEMLPDNEWDDDPYGGGSGSGSGSTATCVAHTDEANRDSDNLTKYWAYRERLRDQFIKVSPGDEPGTNMPTVVRIRDERGYKMRWGDGTIYHAVYVSMLATEYALLHQREDTSETLRELLYALRAIERLDASAESYFRTTTRPLPAGLTRTGDLNGFFIRSDTPENFLERFAPQFADVYKVRSEVTHPYNDYYASEVSQDQIWHLMTALALTRKLVDYVGYVDGQKVDFRSYAKRITARIVRYQRDHEDWRIINPVLGKYVLRGAEWDARAIYSYGFAEAANWVLQAQDSCDTTYESMHNTSSLDAKNLFKWSDAINGDPNEYALRSLATVGKIKYNTWNDLLWSLEHDTLASKHPYEHFPLVYVVLHGGMTRLNPHLYGGLLNAAPAKGPYNYKDNTDICAWSAPNRLHQPENGDTGVLYAGDYAGIDYMLLHNLYQLVYGGVIRSTLYGPTTYRAPPQTEDMMSGSSKEAVVSATSIYGNNSTFAGWRAFDRALHSRWVSGVGGLPGTPQAVTYEFKNGPRAVMSYAIQFGDSADAMAGRAPKAWRLEGSQNGSSWTLLDSRSSQTNWASFERRTFTINKTPTPMRYFRLVVTATQGSDVTTIAELELIGFGYANEVPTLSGFTTAGVKVSQSSQIDSSATTAGWVAFDRAKPSNGTSWVSAAGMPQWLAVDWDTDPAIARYAVTFRDPVPGRAPSAWQLQGYSPTEGWVNLDSRTSQTLWSQGQRREFAIAKPGSYRSYRLHVTATNGDSVVSINELELLSLPRDAVQVPRVTTCSTGGSGGGGTTYDGSSDASLDGSSGPVDTGDTELQLDSY